MFDNILGYSAAGLAAILAAASGIAVIKKLTKRRRNKDKTAPDSGANAVSGSVDRSEWENFYKLLKSTSAVVWEYDFENKKLSAARGDTFHEIPDFRNTLISDGTMHPSSVDTFNHFCNEFLAGRTHCNCELRMKLPGSEQYSWFVVNGLLQRNRENLPEKYYGQCINIDASHKRFDRLAQSSEIDFLTNFNTRYGAKDRVNEWLGTQPSADGALFLVDVDHFRSISETVGFLFGDELLVALSEKLVEIFPADSFFGRINNDEFVIYVKNVGSREEAGEFARACCACMDQFFVNTEQTERVSCSVGIARFPQDGRTYEDLYYKADVALFMSKFSGRNTFNIYEDGMDAQLSGLAGESGLKSAEPEEEDISSAQNDTVKIYHSGLLSQVIEMLFESRELSSSINMTISLIGRKLGFDYCGITDYSSERGALDFKYMWRSGKLSRYRLGTLPLCCDNGKSFYCRKLDDLPAELRCAVSDFEEAGVTSFVQCPVMDGAELCGFISYCVCDSRRELSEEVLQQVSLVSKIIGGYLRQLKVMQDMKRMGEVDRLTGTMSITRFIEEAESILSRCPDSRFAIVYADIDRFKFINETYGYKAGDSILKRMAQIIMGMEGSNELVSRVDADKFVGLVEYTDFDQLMERLLGCDKLVNSIKKTDNDCYKLPLRAGIYLVSPDDKTSVSAMVDKANLARKNAKDVHHSTYMVFDESMKSRIKRQKEIEDVMRDALANNEFLVYFQPKFSLLKGQIVGAEALVRWNRPGYGLVPPDDFIPIFEDNGFIIDLDFYVLELVCRKLRHDIDEGLSTRPISVNFSRVHLGTPDFIQRIRSYLEKYDIPANLIEVEITESALTDNEDYLVDILGSLHSLGLIVSMDDFGSGYSSLNLLKRLPFDVLKIDKDFFTGKEATERERLIIANVVNMARSLNIRVVSEGVETVEQADFLRNIKCDQVQGFLYAHPMDMASYEKLYQNDPSAAEG